MRRRGLAWFVFVIASGCVEVPDTIKTDFSPPGPADRSNYRPGAHGAARPASEAAPKLATTTDAGAATVDPGDAQ